MVATLDHEGEESAVVVEGEAGHLKSEEDGDTLLGRKAKASNLSESLDMEDSVTNRKSCIYSEK